MRIKLRKYITKLCVGVPLLSAAIVGLVISNNIYKENEPTVVNFLCPPVSFVNEEESEAVKESGIALAKQIVRESAVLVKNEGNVLPLDKSVSRVNVFGYGSVDWIVGGSGSGQIINEQGVTTNKFLDCLENYGIQYNKDLSNFYSSYSDPRGTVAILAISSHSSPDFYKLCEPKMSEYSSSLLSNAKSFSDTALVVLSRRAGESLDPPRTQYKIKGTTDTSRHYLEISTEEEALLTYVGSNFSNVVVIINSTNAMELGFLDSINGLDACFVAGTSGNNGATGLCELIWGDYSPSGHLADTYPYKFSSNINYNHAGLENVNHYTNAGALGLYPKGVRRNAGTIYTDNASYVDYIEGIYIGYKWYETADKEGYWDRAPYNGYENVVQFPFGYGQSYTTFSWKVDSEKSVPTFESSITNESEIELHIEVTNTGNKAGQDVVQVYLTAPYTNGGIEKSYVTFQGSQKTGILEPGQTEILKLAINAKEFESYDAYDKNNNSFKGYELEAGQYELKLMTDSHNLKKVYFGSSTTLEDGVIKYKVDNTIKVTNDEVTGNKIENRFTGDNVSDKASLDGSNGGTTIQFISRSNFPELSQTKAPDRAINDIVKYNNLHASTSQNSEWDASSTDYFGNPIDTTSIAWGSKSGVKLFNDNGTATEKGLQLGKDYDDPDWENILDQITYNEALGIVNSSQLTSAAIPSVNKALSHDYDGPAQVRSFNGGNNPGTGFPSSSTLACSFSPRLAYLFGLAYGSDMIDKGENGAYAFGCNLHRSPFQGRNYEYLSEDPILTASFIAEEIRGVKNMGKYCFLKHLVCAENEHEREATYTWMTEQTLRENYLKPFQWAVEKSDTGGIMTSYNRIGSQWTGASEALCTGVIRYEWGFKGAFVTDWSDHNQYMNNASAVRAGGNLGMATRFGNVDINNASIRLQHRLRDVVKQVLYCHLSPLYAASIYDPSKDGSSSIISTALIMESWNFVTPLVTVIDIVGGLFIGYGYYMVLRPIPPKEKAQAENPKRKNKEEK